MGIQWGHSFRPSPQRMLIADFMTASRNIPLVTVSKPMDVRRVAEARNRWPERPSWAALFFKGMALLSQERPELRRYYQTFPWTHLYEHPESVGGVTVERTDEGGAYALVLRFRGPEHKSIRELTNKIRAAKTSPGEAIGEIRMARRMARLPGPLRRALYGLIMNWGAVRAHWIGTFAVTSLGASGVGGHRVVTPTNCILHFGPLKAGADLDTLLTFDHRIFDGGEAGRSLIRLEEIMNGAIVKELDDGAATARAAA